MKSKVYGKMLSLNGNITLKRKKHSEIRERLLFGFSSPSHLCEEKATGVLNTLNY